MKFQNYIRHEILMDLETFLKCMNLDLTRIDYRLDVGTSISIDQEINPIEFLEFAENDLARGDKQGLVNALSNAKRAIDSQVDKVFSCFGIKKRRNFPQKMQVLQEIGLLAPRVVSKVINSRNLLEHQYKLPIRDEVEDAVDIANLFVFAIDNNLNNFCEHFFIGTALENRKLRQGDFVCDKDIDIIFDYEEYKFLLTGYVLETKNLIEDYNMEFQKIKEEIGQVILTPEDAGYLQFIGIAGRIWNYDVRKNIVGLIQNLLEY